MFLDMWSQVETNKVIGGLWPNDGDGKAWGDPERGLPAGLRGRRLHARRPGPLREPHRRTSAPRSRQFKTGDVEILTGVPIPPDFTTFWKQAKQQGFTPKVASVGKALLFPDSVDALGDDGDGLSTEVWWSPNHPFSSSLTGQSAKELADGLHGGHEQAVDPADRLRPRHVRGRPRRPQPRRRDRAGRRSATPSRRPTSTPSSARSSGGPMPTCRRTSPRRRWSAGSGRRATAASSPTTWSSSSNKDHPDIPAAGTLRPIPGS